MRHVSSLLAVIVLLAGLVPVQHAHAQTAPAPRIDPEIADNETVQFNEWVTITGPAGDATSIDSAALLAIEAGGTRHRQPITALNSDPNDPGRSYALIEDGQLAGRARLGCFFGGSQPECPHGEVTQVVLEVVLGGQRYESNALRLDSTRPVVVRYDITAPNRVVAVFSERVRLRANSILEPGFDSAVDWSLSDPDVTVQRVSAVTGDCPDGSTGCTRVLETSTIPEDATPEVWYNPPAGRPVYIDYGGNILRREDGSGVRQRAVDRVIPAVPGISQVAGRAPSSGRVAWREAAPTLSLTNLTAGQTLRIEVDGRPVGDAITATGQTMQVAVPNLGADRDGISIAVVAIDASGNCSSNAASGTAYCAQSQPGSPPRANGANNPVLYDLDTAAPTPLSVSQVAATDLRVTFSEVVTPTGSAGRFTLADGTVAQSVTGEGATRLVRFAQPVPPGAALRWEPTTSSTPLGGTTTSTYQDRVQLQLSWPTGGIVPTPIPLPALPVIQVPGAGVVTNATSTPIGGTQQVRAGEQLVVQVYSDAAGTTAVGDPIPVSGGTWSGTVDLPGGSPADQDVTYTARAIDSATGVRSPVATANTITVDRVAPSVEVTQPTSESIVNPDAPAVGPGILAVEWTASDPNPDRFELTMVDAAGAPIACEGDDWTGEGPYQGACEITEGTAAGDATITVRAIDLATNTAQDTSVPIPIDPEILGAIATLQPPNGQPSQVRIDYTQPLSGQTSGFDWRADDGRGGAVTRAPLSAQRSEDVVTLTFPQAFAEGHPNARPVYAYTPPFLGGGLEGPAGEPIPTSGPVFDVIPARLVVDAVPATTNGLGNRQQLATCTTPGATGPACPPSGPVLRITGQTDTGLDVDASGGAIEPDEVNSVTIVRGDLAQPGAHPRLATAVVNPGTGAWEAILPLDPGQPLTATVVAEDINPFPSKAPTTQVITVLDDSVGPTITTMVATLVTSEADDVVVVPMTFSEIAQRVELTYRLGTGAEQPLGTLEPGADQATYRWTDLPFEREDLAAGLQITAIATDLVGNVGPARTVGLSNLPRLQSATLLDELTVQVTTTEPVTTDQAAAAGFAIGGGPGVARAASSGAAADVITLSLADPIDAGEFTVRYNGQGGWASPDDERPLQAGEVPLVIDDTVLLPVTGLAAGPSCTGEGVVLSFVDERNGADGGAAVTGYEVTRDGELIATLGPDERIVTDEDAGDGVHVYEVTPIGADGVRGDPVTIRIEVGGSPVPADAVQAALAAGTGAPAGTTARDDVVFGGQPSIGATGGTVLSCDGRVAALVPPGVLDGPAYGAFVRLTGAEVDGLDRQGDLYQLVAVRAEPGFGVLDAAQGFIELSFRDHRDVLDQVDAERVTAVRVRGGEGADGAAGPPVADEVAALVGTESVAGQLVTLGTFALAEADGASVRVAGVDPGLAQDRFATAAALAQTRYRAADTVVLARADDYPDALAAAPLAAQVGGPVLLSRTGDVPQATLYELARLGTSRVHLVGGTAALSEAVQAQLEAAGLTVVRTAGPTRFETAAEVARLVGSVDGRAFLATGQGFADALAASSPAAALGRPILLTTADEVPAATREALDALLVVGVDLVGGEVAIGAGVAEGLAADGFAVRRSAGPTRYATAVALADRLVEAGQLDLRQLVMASGDGDGRTSPDALAAGPVAGRLGGPLLLTPQAQLTEEVATFLADAAALRGLYLAGGPVAVSDEARAAIDEAAAR